MSQYTIKLVDSVGSYQSFYVVDVDGEEYSCNVAYSRDRGKVEIDWDHCPPSWEAIETDIKLGRYQV